MKRPTVKPIAIWIIDAATLKTIELRLSVVVSPAALTEPRISAEAVVSAELMLPLDARLPGTWT